MPTEEELRAEIERLRAENEVLKKPTRGQLSLKVSEKGALSVYGLGRFPDERLAAGGWRLSGAYHLRGKDQFPGSAVIINPHELPVPDGPIQEQSS